METAPTRRWLILAVLCLSVFLVVVDNTIINVALPSFSRDLHASSSSLQWIVDGYSLPFAGLLLAGSGLADRLGRKLVMQCGLIAFGLFSLYASFSNSTGTLISARALMGVAAAFVFPASLSILTTTFTNPQERAKAFGLWGATSGVAVAVGPLTGGALITHFWYGSIFFVNIPLVAIAWLAGWRVIPESKGAQSRRVDAVGLVTGSLGVTALVYAIIEGPDWGWLASGTLGVFGVAVVLLTIFTLYESHREGPLLDVSLFRNRAFSAGAVAIATSFFILFGFIFLITQYFQVVRGYSALSSGVHTLPFAFISVLVTPLGAVVAFKVGSRYVVTLGLLLMSASMAWMATLGVSAPYWGPLVLSMLVMGAGFSLITAPSTAAVMGSLRDEQIGSGSAVNNVTRELGGTMGVAVVGSVFASYFAPHVRQIFLSIGAPAAAANQAGSSIEAAVKVASALPGKLSATVSPDILSAFMSGVHRGCWTAAMVGVAVACITAICLPGTPTVPSEMSVPH